MRNAIFAAMLASLALPAAAVTLNPPDGSTDIHFVTLREPKTCAGFGVKDVHVGVVCEPEPGDPGGSLWRVNVAIFPVGPKFPATINLWGIKPSDSPWSGDDRDKRNIILFAWWTKDNVRTTEITSLEPVKDDKGNIVSFYHVVPEPATWALMVAGFGIVGAGMRRQRLVASRTVAS